MFRRALLWTTVLLLGLGGCASEPELPMDVKLRAASEAMDIDPTQEQPVAGWWSNGEDLMWIDTDGSYWIFAGNNPHYAPRERGQWWRTSYAWIGLEPYPPASAETTRVELVRVAREVALELPDRAPLLPIDRPPSTTEDALFGAWRSSADRLVLGDDMRYALVRSDASRDSGRWRVADGEVALEPFSPVYERRRLLIDRTTSPLGLRDDAHGFDYELDENSG